MVRPVDRQDRAEVLVRTAPVRLVRPDAGGPERLSLGHGKLALGGKARKLDAAIAGTTLAYILALIAAIQAFGGGLSVPQIGAAYLGASLVGNASPTPGGLGAVEAALVAALTGFGLESGHAVSAVLTFRLATYWLPTLPGWFVFRWMQQHDEI